MRAGLPVGRIVEGIGWRSSQRILSCIERPDVSKRWTTTIRRSRPTNQAVVAVSKGLDHNAKGILESSPFHRYCSGCQNKGTPRRWSPKDIWLWKATTSWATTIRSPAAKLPPVNVYPPVRKIGELDTSEIDSRGANVKQLDVFQFAGVSGIVHEFDNPERQGFFFVESLVDLGTPVVRRAGLGRVAHARSYTSRLCQD